LTGAKHLVNLSCFYNMEIKTVYIVIGAGRTYEDILGVYVDMKTANEVAKQLSDAGEFLYGCSVREQPLRSTNQYSQ
jgi:hypothetical protein